MRLGAELERFPPSRFQRSGWVAGRHAPNESWVQLELCWIALRKSLARTRAVLQFAVERYHVIRLAREEEERQLWERRQGAIGDDAGPNAASGAAEAGDGGVVASIFSEAGEEKALVQLCYECEERRQGEERSLLEWGAALSLVSVCILRGTMEKAAGAVLGLKIACSFWRSNLQGTAMSNFFVPGSEGGKSDIFICGCEHRYLVGKIDNKTNLNFSPHARAGAAATGVLAACVL